jgi:hypothetical protein
MCNSGSDESIEHLFINFPFVTARWDKLNLRSAPQSDPFASQTEFRQ